MRYIHCNDMHIHTIIIISYNHYYFHFKCETDHRTTNCQIQSAGLRPALSRPEPQIHTLPLRQGLLARPWKHL